MEAINGDHMVLNKEVEFNDWLFTHLHKLLVNHGFIVESEKVNKDVIPNVNEYSTSKPDCLIYHTSSVSENVSGMNVHIVDDTVPDRVSFEDFDVQQIECDSESMSLTLSTPISQQFSSSCESIDVEDPIELGTSASGCAIEVKSFVVNNASLNECYYNMFGAGTRLATTLLQCSKIVKKVTIYGVVVSMQDPDRVQALKLLMDFSQGHCWFWYAAQHLSFEDTMNILLSKLKN